MIRANYLPYSKAILKYSCLKFSNSNIPVRLAILNTWDLVSNALYLMLLSNLRPAPIVQWRRRRSALCHDYAAERQLGVHAHSVQLSSVCSSSTETTH